VSAVWRWSSSLWRHWSSALGPFGMLAGSFAALVAFVFGGLTLFTLSVSMRPSELHSYQDYEFQLLDLEKKGFEFFRVMENMSAGILPAREGRAVLQRGWREFRATFDRVCPGLHPGIPNTERLREVCVPDHPFAAQMEAAIAGFDPPTRGIDPGVMAGLLVLRDEIIGLSRYATATMRDLEDRLADHYEGALRMLVIGTLGFVASAFVLLFLVGRASVRHFNASRDAERERQRLKSIVESSGAAIVVTDGQLRVTMANRGFWRVTGLDPGQTVGRSLDKVMGGRPTGIPPEWFTDKLPAGEITPALFVDRVTRPDGAVRTFTITATPVAGDDGRISQLVCVGVDDTERRQAEQALLDFARYDRLTGLPNRAQFVDKVAAAIERAGRGGTPFAVLYLDLDHFKDINDTLGHPVGDRLLKLVARRLREHVREDDVVARFGGDEFAILQGDVDTPEDAAALARNLVELLRQPFDIAGNTIRTGASIGISLYGPDASEPETILANADMALYRAKAEGRATYSFFTDAIDREVRSRVALAADLRDGMAAGQLLLVYQPQVLAANGRLTGVEALVRWRHPTRGLVPPNVFIPIAEKSGLIHALGRWVLQEACRQGRVWVDAGIAPPRIAVNFSALQFRAPRELEKDIAAALAEARLPPSMLEIEITESALMAATREHSDLLQRLRARGHTVAIDDFGTGYSSLLYLHRFPVDRLKIAQDFVRDIVHDNGDAAITRVAIGLARELGLAVIAEGVETADQLGRLMAWGCPEIQGYLASRPVEPEQLAPLLSARRAILPGGAQPAAAS
jgi:diguanylate cyclase (GGDEF)-like protein/PAS domain S-box-containing protein